MTISAPICSQCHKQLPLERELITGFTKYDGWACKTCKRIFCDPCAQKWHGISYGFCPTCNQLLSGVMTMNGAVQWNLA